MNRLKITTVGSSAGVVLPKDVLARLRVDKVKAYWKHDAAQISSPQRITDLQGFTVKRWAEL